MSKYKKLDDPTIASNAKIAKERRWKNISADFAWLTRAALRGLNSNFGNVWHFFGIFGNRFACANFVTLKPQGRVQ
jgi:hypothetical protein